MTHNNAIPIVVKHGGNAMTHDATDPVLAEVAAMWKARIPIIVVHGGGPEVDRWLAKQSIATRRIDGLRVTDAATLEITEAVLCGTLNKRIVRALTALGVPAVGVSGQDGRTLIAARARGTGDADLGFVGEIVECSPTLIHALLRNGFLPVIAPLALAGDASSTYNVNADLAAAAIAVAMNASAFVAVKNVRRVLGNPDDPASGIDRIDTVAAHAFLESDACRESMKPKLRSALVAAEGGVPGVYICGSAPGAIRRAIDGDATVIFVGSREN
jgi:acetylglutamate kinase